MSVGMRVGGTSTTSESGGRHPGTGVQLYPKTGRARRRERGQRGNGYGPARARAGKALPHPLAARKEESDG